VLAEEEAPYRWGASPRSDLGVHACRVNTRRDRLECTRLNIPRPADGVWCTGEPSRLAGWQAWQARYGVRRRLSLEIPKDTFASEGALVARLLSEENSAESRFLYRGQGREYRRRWPLIDGPFRDLTETDLIDVSCWRCNPGSLKLPVTLVRELMDLPSLIPTNTRAYERYLQGGADWQENAFEDMMVYFWTAVCIFLLGLACRVLGDSDGLQWLESQWNADYPALYKLRSVGQHYGMDTGLLDATTSVPVALWFATHDFATGSYRANDSAILYRIDREGLRRVEAWLRNIPEHEGKFDAASVDIRDTPPMIALRASRQQGWSLVGWDHPRLVIRMAAERLITRCDFCTGSAPTAVNCLTREYITPGKDPMAKLFAIFWQKRPRSLDDAQVWIDENWNVAASKRIVLDEDGSWFEGLSSEIGSIYTYQTERVRAAFDKIG
jgi:FRG domain